MNKTIYNMSKATKINFAEQPDGSFYIQLFFDKENVSFRYEDKTKAEEAFALLSKFKGTCAVIGDNLTIDIKS